jgi:prepilin-type N-terminal cleavage/methylation domain-containing protein
MGFQIRYGARAVTRRRGFSLVEVIISMSLLAIVSVLLASLAVSIGRRARTNDLTTKRNLVLVQEASRISSMPLSYVAQLTSGTTQMLVGDFTFNRVLTVSSPATNRYTIKIVIKPLAGEFRADSVQIDRTRPASNSPLCTTC